LPFQIKEVLDLDAKWPEKPIPALGPSPWQIAYEAALPVCGQNWDEEYEKAYHVDPEKYFYFTVQFLPESPAENWPDPIDYYVPRWYRDLLVDFMFPSVSLAKASKSKTKKKAGKKKSKKTKPSLTDDAAREWMYTAEVFKNFLEEAEHVIEGSTMSEATQLKSLHCYAAREVLGLTPLRHNAAGRAAYERAMREGFKVKPYSVNSALWCTRYALSSRSTVETFHFQTTNRSAAWPTTMFLTT
jgi:hypothetical protein